VVLNFLAGDIYPTAVSLNLLLVSRNIVAVRLNFRAVLVNILAGNIYPTAVSSNAGAVFLSFLVVPGRLVQNTVATGLVACYNSRMAKYRQTGKPAETVNTLYAGSERSHHEL